jgi:hypothetical protein
MTHKLPIVTLGGVATGAILATAVLWSGAPSVLVEARGDDVTSVAAQPLKVPAARAAVTTAGAVNAVTAGGTSGALIPRSGADADSPQNLVRRAAERLAAFETIRAKLRMKVRLFDRELVGTGRYVQGPRETHLLRYELSLQSGKETSGVLQVCDGTDLWIRDYSPGRNALRKVDVAKALAAGQGSGAPHDTAAMQVVAGEAAIPGIGGLPRLVETLERTVEFSSARPVEISGVPMIEVSGRWSSEFLKWLSAPPDKQDKPSDNSPPELADLPQHMPDAVAIYLARDDLFPYRIEYRRTTHERPHFWSLHRSETTSTILELQWHDVSFNSAVDRAEFTYKPGDTPVTDYTDAFARGMERFR